MDLFFLPTIGRPFSIEVGYFDSVLEIKEKIQKKHGIPISKQTLIFNGYILIDELNVHYSEILDRSHINLIVASDPEDQNRTTTGAKMSHKLSMPPINPLNQIQLTLKMPTSKLVLEMDINDSVRKLKEKIEEMEGVPVSRLMIHVGGVELYDHQTLLDCELFYQAEIDVSIRTSPSTATSSSSGNINGTKKLKILVITKSETMMIPVEVEVSPSDNVGQLRNELQKLNRHLGLSLPPKGYFFVYKQNVMDDDRSFSWHHVRHGDTIEVFNRSISTGGT